MEFIFIISESFYCVLFVVSVFYFFIDIYRFKDFYDFFFFCVVKFLEMRFFVVDLFIVSR